MFHPVQSAQDRDQEDAGVAAPVSVEVVGVKTDEAGETVGSRTAKFGKNSQLAQPIDKSCSKDQSDEHVCINSIT
jgi:hypothetical protein